MTGEPVTSEPVESPPIADAGPTRALKIRAAVEITLGVVLFAVPFAGMLNQVAQGARTISIPFIPVAFFLVSGVWAGAHGLLLLRRRSAGSRQRAGRVRPRDRGR
jgi:hypothetical protein